MYVCDTNTDDWTVRKPDVRGMPTIIRLRQILSESLRKTLHTENPVFHSPAFLPSRWPRRLNESNADLIHLHWVGGEMMSIADIGRLRKPVVWTMHDMWGFCGAEHLTEEFRWRDGYLKHNRPAYESGFDLNRWIWQRKLNHWHRPMHIVTPSRWLGDCARQSVIMREWPVSVIPNPIDVDAWRPIDKMQARRLLGLPDEGPLLLFGALGGTRDRNKGFDLLKGALDYLRGEIAGLELVILGQSPPKVPMDLGFRVHFAGHLNDDISLRLYYSAADGAFSAGESSQRRRRGAGLRHASGGIQRVRLARCRRTRKNRLSGETLRH